MSKPKPTLRLANQCKLCKLLRTHPEFWTEIHDKILKQDYSKASVCKWANAKIEVMNASEKDEEKKLVKFSEQNFARHFQKHANFEMHQDLQRQKILAKNSRLLNQQGFSDDEVEVAEQYSTDLTQKGVAEYVSLAKMISTLEDSFWRYDETIKAKDKRNPKREISIMEIQGYQKQVESLMKLKIELSKLRNSSAVAGMAIETAVEYTVSAFVEIMMAATEEAQSILTTELPGSSVPFEVSKLVRNKIADTMKGLVPEIIDKVTSDYSIK